MKILVKVKAGMDAHFKTTVKGYDKGAVTMRPDPSSPWDYIIENFAACPVDEVGRWQSVERAAADAPPKPKEYKISDLARIMSENNSRRGHKESHEYKLITFIDPTNAIYCRLRKSNAVQCIRVEKENNYEVGVENIQKFIGSGTGNDLPLKNSQDRSPKEIKVVPYDGQEVIAFYF